MARLTDLLSVEEARARILSRLGPLPVERVELVASLGRVLAERVVAGIDLPPFPNSSMDGFAVQSAATRTADARSPVMLRVTSQIPAGTWSDVPVLAGTCARIMTGAPLPPGSDAVIPFEDVAETADSIAVSHPVSPGASVRPAGNDLRAGTTVLEAGAEIHAPQIGLLAALGIAEVAVRRRPTVAVLSTGDELVAPGTPLQPGQIYNSNTPMLVAAILEAGGRPQPLRTSGDDPDAIAATLREAQDTDLLLTSGGASVGDFDHVKDVVGGAGELSFWRVRVRPGKPLLFGRIGPVPIIGLPGNPTSAMVTFEEFARPAIRTMLGAAPLRPEIVVVLDEPIDNRGGRRTYVRVRLRQENGRIHARLAGSQDSAMLYPLAQADGLLIAPEDRQMLDVGESATVQVWQLPAR